MIDGKTGRVTWFTSRIRQVGMVDRDDRAAAILVTRKCSHWTGGDRYCDIRVDSHPEAVQEMGRILARHSFI